MPVTRTRSSRSTVQGTNIHRANAVARDPSTISIPEDLEQLHTPQLRNLCRTLNLLNTGARRTLKTRLLNEKNRRQGESAVEAPSSAATVPVAQEQTVPQGSTGFNDAQIAQITSIVQRSMETFFDDRHRETDPVSPAIQRETRQPNDEPANLLDPGDLRQTATSLQRLEQLGQSFPFLTSPELRQVMPTAVPVAHSPADGGFTPEIPAKFIRDIESGEFFELSKLLPKNLNRSNVGSDYPDNNVSFTVSASGISLTPRKPQVLTNIEDWTTAFNTYMLIVVHKFPTRAGELLQYMETIRHAAKTHGGLGWCIYDHKFRYKAANCRTMSWATIDTQLWLRIFTASSEQLREDYSLFSNGPSYKRTGATRDGLCHSYNRGRPCPNKPNCPYAHRCNRPGCGGNHPGYKCSTNEGVSEEATENHTSRGSNRRK